MKKRTIDCRYGVPRPLSSRDRIYQVYFFSRPPERPCIRRLRAVPQRQSIAAMATNTPTAAVRLSRVLVDLNAFVTERATGDVNLPVHIITEMTIVDMIPVAIKLGYTSRRRSLTTGTVPSRWKNTTSGLSTTTTAWSTIWASQTTNRSPTR